MNLVHEKKESAVKNKVKNKSHSQSLLVEGWPCPQLGHKWQNDITSDWLDWFWWNKDCFSCKKIPYQDLGKPRIRACLVWPGHFVGTSCISFSLVIVILQLCKSGQLLNSEPVLCQFNSKTWTWMIYRYYALQLAISERWKTSLLLTNTGVLLRWAPMSMH